MLNYNYIMSELNTNMFSSPDSQPATREQLDTTENLMRQFLAPVPPQLYAEHSIRTADGVIIRMSHEWEDKSLLGSVAALSIKSTFDPDPRLVLIYGTDDTLSSANYDNEGYLIKAAQQAGRVIDDFDPGSDERTLADHLQLVATAKYWGQPANLDRIGGEDETGEFVARLIRSVIDDKSTTTHKVIERTEELSDGQTLNVTRREIDGLFYLDDEFAQQPQLEVELMSGQGESRLIYTRSFIGQPELDTPINIMLWENAAEKHFGVDLDEVELSDLDNYRERLGLFIPNQGDIRQIVHALQRAQSINYNTEKPTILDL